MEIRLDEIVYSKEDTQKLGIETGDYICIDPKTTITENGFVKSRFIDDKISCCILMGVLKYFHDNQIIPMPSFIARSMAKATCVFCRQTSMHATPVPRPCSTMPCSCTSTRGLKW